MHKIDLHTHSIASPDGGIRLEQYADILESGLLDYVAITDHDTIELAQSLHETLGDKIIVGEEVTTMQGEVIGLFLTELVPKGLSISDTVKAIKAQDGLVYVPHPFETVRKGLDEFSLASIDAYIDILEVHNGRAVFQNRGPQAAVWAKLHGKAVCASSDAHGMKGIGTTYTAVSGIPTAVNLVGHLRQARMATGRPPLHTLLYPKANRLKKRLKDK